MKKATVLLSGGQDSTTCLAIAKDSGFECCAISFNYGQKNYAELNAARKVAAYYGASHKIINIPLDQIGGSALTDSVIDVPDYIGSGEIPMTYVPARNTIFLSFALGWSEILNIKDIFIGVNAVDYSGYPDCRPEYIQAFQRMANLATKAGVEGANIHIHTPLIYLSKAQILNLGTKLGVNYQMTVTCYRANEDGYACGYCDSCVLRKKGFEEAGLDDATLYVQYI